jgi:phage tail sheath protein FI
MPFQLSPGVAVVEKDFTSIVPAVSSSVGAFAGTFAWGPVMAPFTVSSENELVRYFGKPQDANAQAFFTAANFLSYTNNLLVCRADVTAARNSVSTSSGTVTSVAVGTAGSGYTSAAAAPAVTFAAPSIAGGVTATGTATLSGGGVTGVTIAAGGSGYTAATVAFSAPQVAGGVTAVGTVVITSGAVSGITITTAGTGYTAVPTATISGNGSNATAGTITLSASSITGITITNAGSGYTGAPTVTVAAPPSGVTALATSTITTGGVKINNASDYLSAYSTGQGVFGEFSAKYPGALGNSLKVSMADSQSYAAWAYKDEFDGAPASSSYAVANGGSSDEMHVIVVDEDGLWTGIQGATLEKFAFVSKASDCRKADGTNNFYKDVINATSDYIWWLDHVEQGAISTAFAQSTAYVKGQILTQGGNSYIVSTAGTSHPSTAPTHTTGAITNGTAILTFISASTTNWGSTVTASAGLTFGLIPVAINRSLSGGVDALTATDGQLENAWMLFADDGQYDISLLPLGKCSGSLANNIIQNVCGARLDCVAFASPQNTSTGEVIIGQGSSATTQITAYRDLISSSSYGVMDSGYKYQYDRYNDVYRYVPLNGDTAGLCARTDYTNDPWFSPGGLNRGQVKGVVKLAHNPTKTDRDILYKKGINPVVNFPGEGTVLYGDKTLLTKPSAFDRINVRRLFIVMEKAIATAAKYQLFEFNDSFTRAQFKNLVEPFLRDVQGRRGITEFVVKCDESNNTGQVIDANQFVADIFVKPNRSINFITLNFVAARSSVSFNEVGA